MNVEDHIQDFIHTRSKLEWHRILRRLVSIKENCDKIKFVLDVLEKENFLGFYKIIDGKNNEKSVEYRKHGNTYFSLRNKDYLRALEYYNKSICYAESNTQFLATGYANRSAIYYEWEMYALCLENIELAFKSCASLSDNLRQKLMNRKTLCLNNINVNKPYKTLDECGSTKVKLTYPAHPTVPFIANCLVMDYNEQCGQLIKTTRDLYPGDCIAIERPLCAMVELGQIYKLCAHCLIENNCSLIPCPNCTSTMYCSETCLTTAYTNSHRFECSAINGPTTIFTSGHLTALNVVLKLFSNDNYLNKTFAYLNDFRPMTVYDFNYKIPYDYADEYKLLHNLVTNTSVFGTHELFCVAARAAILYKLVKTNKYLKDIFLKSTVGRNYEKLFLNLLYHNLLPGNFVFHLGRVIKSHAPLWIVSEYGSAIYPFYTLLNHSCIPNVIKIPHGSLNDHVLFVSRKIASGEQVLFSYGDCHHTSLTRQMRQKELERFNVKCICDACRFDYPIYEELELHPNLPRFITDRVKMELCVYNRQYARSLLRIVVDYLKKYDKLDYPTMQVVDAEKALKKCLTILLN